MSKRITKSTVPTIYMIDANDGFNSAESIEMANVLEASNSTEAFTIAEETESFIASNSTIESSPKVGTHIQTPPNSPILSSSKMETQIQTPHFKQERHCSSKQICEAIDGVFIFTLLHGILRHSWAVKACQMRDGTFKNCLEIEGGNPDGSLSNFIVWGDGKTDVVLNFVLSYFRYFHISTKYILNVY